MYKLIKLLKEPDAYMLTIFDCITLFMLTCTIFTTILCFFNYDKGLKTYGQAKNKDLHSRNPSENPILLQHTAYGVRPFLPHRMTID